MNLNEDTLLAGVKVRWRDKVYVTGNRYHNFVELYKNGNFIRTVLIDHISKVGKK